ncbi:hypothetical protein RvY_00847 [Ramazzottius varieornatus]|uniref:Uncharacterized protein n=1 Tax=Ramazzottius varieornatus TaxID=947166 RepID=A0A1D1UEM4_RAMVA|nr:hypothetical protein RvY_00847 [Ramazzottius varieornatus]
MTRPAKSGKASLSWKMTSGESIRDWIGTEDGDPQPPA